MNKKVKTTFLALLSWLIVGCGVPVAAQEAILGTPEVVYSATPEATGTATVTPTPTVNWQGTAVVAQATADEARRLDTQATAQEKDRIQEQLAWTAAANQWTAQADQWTATAALTSIPLTATQQMVMNTQVPIEQALAAGQLTATKEAPTQIVAMIDARNYETYGATEYVVRLIVLGALGVFLLGVGLFALAARPKEEVKAGNAETAEVGRDPDLIPLRSQTIVKVKTDHGQGWGQDQLYTVPCTREQLNELAERVIVRGESLGVNNFEGKDTLFTRSVFMRVRNFLQANFMAKGAGVGAGSMVLTEKGEAFLRGWLERKSLPHSFTFAPSDGGALLNMSHDHEAHATAHGGGT